MSDSYTVNGGSVSVKVSRTTDTRALAGAVQTRNDHTRKLLQESCAIAKMTAQCAPYMGALKIFGTP